MWFGSEGVSCSCLDEMLLGLSTSMKFLNETADPPSRSFDFDHQPLPDEITDDERE